MSNVDVSNKNMLVFDEESSEMVSITPKERDYAEYVYFQLKSSILQTAGALRKIFDEKLYLALGYASKEDFAIRGTDISYRQANKMVAVSRKFSPYLAEISESTGNGESRKSTSYPESSESRKSTSYSDLGIEKLYKLSRLNDEDFEKFMTTDELGDGDNKLLMQEFRESTVRKAGEKLNSATKGYKKTINKQTDKISTLEEEVKLLKSENKVFVDQIEKAQELDAKYGAKASQIEHKGKLLEFAKLSLDTLDEKLNKANILKDDPEHLTDFYEMLLSRIEKLHVVLIGNYGFLKKDGE